MYLHIYPPGLPKDEAIFLTGESDSRRVDDGHHELNVVHDGPVEELLVAVLEAHEVDVAVQVVLPAGEVLHHYGNLLLLG